MALVGAASLPEMGQHGCITYSKGHPFRVHMDRHTRIETVHWGHLPDTFQCVEHDRTKYTSVPPLSVWPHLFRGSRGMVILWKVHVRMCRNYRLSTAYR